MAKNKKIKVKGFDVVLFQNKKEDYISLTDIAKYKDEKEQIILFKIG